MNRETVLITGANSFIARHLVPILEKNYKVRLLSRQPESENAYFWNPAAGQIDPNALDGVDYIVHLAGSKLNDGTPLTAERKQTVRDSRIGAANFLREKLKEQGLQLKGFVSASAIGYYGFTDQRLEIDEDGQRGMGFMADLCADWEAAADLFKTEGVAKQVSKIRVSLVLGKEGGIFPILYNRLKTQPQLASQPDSASYPWNHVADMAGIFAFALAQKLDGVYNSVAPIPASSQDVMRAIANNLSIQERYDIKPFTGQHLIAQRIIDAGYNFQYPDIQSAVNNLSKS